jgi:hypothetical protein
MPLSLDKRSVHLLSRVDDPDKECKSLLSAKAAILVDVTEQLHRQRRRGEELESALLEAA